MADICGLSPDELKKDCHAVQDGLGQSEILSNNKIKQKEEKGSVRCHLITSPPFGASGKQEL